MLFVVFGYRSYDIDHIHKYKNLCFSCHKHTYVRPMSCREARGRHLQSHTPRTEQCRCIPAASLPHSKTVKSTSTSCCQQSSSSLPQPSSSPARPFPPCSKPAASYTLSYPENSWFCALFVSPRAQNSVLPVLLEKLKLTLGLGVSQTRAHQGE